jgi:cyclopropane fatty-acyl-phospholipid synthase-like methyltransferase
MTIRHPRPSSGAATCPPGEIGRKGRLYQNGVYLQQNPTWHAEDSSWKAEQVVQLLQRNGLDPREVCEVGCGAGEILVHLRRLLPDAREFAGYDISPQAYDLCRSKEAPGLRFHLGDVADEPDVRFDLLLAMDVLEHVEDCFSFLRRLRSKAQWKVFHVPLELSAHRVLRGAPLLATRRAFGHLHYFTRDTLFATLEETGYRVVDYRYTDLSTSPDGRRHGNPVRSLLGLARSALFKVRPDFTARALGGYSILILTK